MKNKIITFTAAALALVLSGCTFGLTQVPGDKNPRVSIGGTITMQDFKNVVKLLNQNR